MLMMFIKKVVKRSFKHNALLVANLYIFIDNTNKTFFKYTAFYGSSDISSDTTVI